MRHRVFGRKLSRSQGQRKALFKGLISSLVIHGRIKTTQARAKAVRGLVDRLITKAKIGGLHGRRQVTVILHDKKVVNKLIDEIVPHFPARTSGFTRIIRLGQRKGDSSMMVELSFVEGEKKREKDKDKMKSPKKKSLKKEEKK